MLDDLVAGEGLGVLGVVVANLGITLLATLSGEHREELRIEHEEYRRRTGRQVRTARMKLHMVSPGECMSAHTHACCRYQSHA